MVRMNLHRTTGLPDWADIPPARRNVFQRIAAVTYGIGTPSNAITMIGFALVIFGLAEILDRHYLLGGALIAIGRLCDVADGWVAEKTQTKSPLGETLDAGADKLITVLTVVVFYITNVAPPLALILLVGPQLIITIISLWAAKAGRRLHPSLIGKFSMASGWVAMVGYLVMAATAEPIYLALLVYALTTLSAALGTVAADDYFRMARTSSKTPV